MKLKFLHNNYQSFLNKEIKVNGWILTVRYQKNICFIKLNDGSNPQGIQLIHERDEKRDEKNDENDKNRLYTGCCISCVGTLVESPSPQQPYELKVNTITLIGNIESDYPLAKTKLSLEYLRKHTHLRSRTSSFGSIFRIKSSISQATHDFFREKDFLHINPNIITINECEGGAGVFQITENSLTDYLSLPTKEETDEKKEKKLYDWDKDHFGKPVFLTVSSQLQLEALACSIGSVYTTNKSFRSEHSNTHKHLSEFEHLEIEDIFIDLDELMSIAEEYIKYVANYLLQNCMDDILNLDKFISKGLLNRVKEINNMIFHRISYDEAIGILSKSNELSKKAVYGEDLCSEFENYLVDYHKGPVFVYNWPSSVKSFYMKQLGNGLCSNFDLLMPYHIGELIGGSMREENLAVMLNVIKEKGVDPKPLSFYTDLRKYGTVPHGGFGLGLDRMCMLFTGIENIKDVVAFPVYYKNCDL